MGQLVEGSEQRTEEGRKGKGGPVRLRSDADVCLGKRGFNTLLKESYINLSGRSRVDVRLEQKRTLNPQMAYNGVKCYGETGRVWDGESRVESYGPMTLQSSSQ